MNIQHNPSSTNTTLGDLPIGSFFYFNNIVGEKVYCKSLSYNAKTGEVTILNFNTLKTGAYSHIMRVRPLTLSQESILIFEDK
jgi:hypothetical protein